MIRKIKRAWSWCSPARTWLRKHESITLWGLVTLMAIVLTNVTLETRHQSAINKTLIHRLDERQNRLCVAVQKGRLVFKQVLDATGLVIATQVALVDCPGATLPKHQ